MRPGLSLLFSSVSPPVFLLCCVGVAGSACERERRLVDRGGAGGRGGACGGAGAMAPPWLKNSISISSGPFPLSTKEPLASSREFAYSPRRSGFETRSGLPFASQFFFFFFLFLISRLKLPPT